MSPEQKQDIINRLTQEYRDAKAEASLIEGEANLIGRNFLDMGHTLINRPEQFVGADGVIDPNPTFQKIHELTARLRQLRSMMTKLRGQLNDAGVAVS